MSFQSYLLAVLMASAVRIPVMTGSAAVFWFAARRLSLLRLDQPFRWHDLQTWPLHYAIFEAVLLGFISAVFIPLLGDTPSGNALASGLATALVLGAASQIPAPRRFQ